MAHLCLLRLWARLLAPEPIRIEPYLRLVGAAVLMLVGLTAALTVLVVLAWRYPSSPIAVAVRWLPLLGLIMAANALLQQAEPANGLLPKILVVLAVAGILLVGRWRQRVLHAAAVLAFIVALMVPLTLGSVAWKTIRVVERRDPFGGSAAGGLVSARPPAVRVLWIIFDELDQRIVFDERPRDLDLPAFARLRAESFYASSAYPPSRFDTIVSVPALMTGKLVLRTDSLEGGDYAVTFASGVFSESLSRQPSVFSQARRAGFDTGIVGWYLPYCSIFRDSVTRCVSFVSGYDLDPLDLSFRKLLGYQSLTVVSAVPFAGRLVSPIVEQFSRQSHIAAHLHVRGAAIAAATDHRLGLVFIHWPLPHRPPIYNRVRGQFTTGKDGTYFDNVALADRAFADLRRAMEGAGAWSRTTILVSADHSWRLPWGAKQNIDPRVPFVLKLPGMQEPFEYRVPFNTIVTQDLLLSLLHGKLSTPKEVSRWLDEQRATNPQARYQP